MNHQDAELPTSQDAPTEIAARISPSLSRHSPAGVRHFLLIFLLAALLFFGSEVLLWSNLPARGAGEWAIRLVGYPALAALLLEIAAQFRMRDLFGLMALAGIYGLLNGLLINPDTALADIPRTWFTRIMGGQSLSGLLMISLFLAFSLRFTRGKIILLILFAGISGLVYGVWARWGVAQGEQQTPISTLLLTAAPVILLAASLCLLLSRRRSEIFPYAIRLSRRAVAVVLLILLALLVVRLLAYTADTVSLFVLGTFIAISLGILYYQRRKKGTAWLDHLGELPAGSWGVVILMMVIAFAAGASAGYDLERGTNASDPVFVIATIFTGYGLFWMPAVCLVLGARAFMRLARQGRL